MMQWLMLSLSTISPGEGFILLALLAVLVRQGRR